MAGLISVKAPDNAIRDAALVVGGIIGIVAISKYFSSKNEPIQNLKIASYTSPVVVGDDCRIVISLDYQGDAATKTLYAALGNDRGVLPFDTMNSRQMAVNLPAKSTRTHLEYEISVPVVSSSTAGGSPYDIYCKLGETDMPRIFNAVVVGSETPNITNAQISSYTSPVNLGGTCKITISFEYSGPATQVNLYGALGNDRGVLPFDTMNSKTVSISIPKKTTPTLLTASVDVNVISSTASGGSPYDVYARIGNVDMDRIFGVVVVKGTDTNGDGYPDTGSYPALVLDSGLTVAQYAQVDYHFLGFAANSYVYLITDDDQYVLGYAQSDDTGYGSGSFNANLSPGEYTIVLKDNQGNTASSLLYVTAGAGGGTGTQVGAVTVKITNAPSNATHWAVQYYDPGFGKFIDGGVRGITEPVYFNNIYPGGYVATQVWTGSAWTGWKYSNEFIPTNGSVWAYDYAANKIYFTYKP